MMRIGLNLLGLPSVRQGGAGFYSELLVRGLATSGAVEAVVVCSETVADELQDASGNLEIVATPGKSIGGPRKVLGLARSIRDPRHYPVGAAPEARRRLEQCAVVHYPLSFMSGPVHRRPTVVTSVDLQHLLLPGLFSRRDRVLRAARWHPSIKRANRVIAISEFTRDTIVSKLGHDPAGIDVVHLACSDQFFLPSREPPPHTRPYLFYPASPLPAKNHERLLQAFSDAASRVAVDLLFSGPLFHDWSTIERHVRELQLSGRVRLLGHLPLRKLVAAYEHAQALIFPSIFEGFGLPIVEAMAAGCPVAAAEAASIPEVLAGHGRLFDPYDVTAIAGAIEWGARARKATGQAEAEAAKSHARTFSRSEMVRQTLKVYASVTDRNAFVP